MQGRVTAQPWHAARAAEAGIWLVEIANPERLNAMTRTMWRQLREAFAAIQNNPTIRCVVVRGEGAAFCAGGDISEYPAFRFDAQRLEDFHEQDVWGGLEAMLACDVPLVASIAGACMGAGVEIASCCDVRLVAEGAKFGAPIAKLGFPMAPKELQLVAGALGVHTARRMLLEAAIFSAPEMAQAGWCAPVLPQVDLQERTLHTAQRIASLSPQAARLNKQTLRALTAGSSIATPYAYAHSAEHQEGVHAFLEKRTPRF